MPIQGMIYQQHRKKVPRIPPILKKDGGLSVDKQMSTTYWHYREALNALYGIPPGFKRPAGWIDPWRREEKYMTMLNHLAGKEDEYGDQFIRRDFVSRSDAELDNAYKNILLEAAEMVDPDLPIYPNPTKDCPWDCNFKVPCIAAEDGSDVDYFLKEGFEVSAERNAWRNKEKIG
jgi:hypothetical protein